MVEERMFRRVWAEVGFGFQRWEGWVGEEVGLFGDGKDGKGWRVDGFGQLKMGKADLRERAGNGNPNAALLGAFGFAAISCVFAGIEF